MSAPSPLSRSGMSGTGAPQAASPQPAPDPVAAMLKAHLAPMLANLPKLPVSGPAPAHVAIRAPEMSFAADKVANRGMFTWFWRLFSSSDKVLSGVLGNELLRLMPEGRDRCVFWKMWSKGMLEIRDNAVTIKPPANEDDRQWLESVLGKVRDVTKNAAVQMMIEKSRGLLPGATCVLNFGAEEPSFPPPQPPPQPARQPSPVAVSTATPAAPLPPAPLLPLQLRPPSPTPSAAQPLRQQGPLLPPPPMSPMVGGMSVRRPTPPPTLPELTPDMLMSLPDDSSVIQPALQLKDVVGETYPQARRVEYVTVPNEDRVHPDGRVERGAFPGRTKRMIDEKLSEPANAEPMRKKAFVARQVQELRRLGCNVLICRPGTPESFTIPDGAHVRVMCNEGRNRSQLLHAILSRQCHGHNVTFEGPHGVANNSFDSIRPAGLAMAVQRREDIGLAHSKAADFDREEADGLGEGQVSFAGAVGVSRSPRAGEEARMPGINGTLGDMCMRKVHTDANPDPFTEMEIAALRDWFTNNYWKVKQPGRGEPDVFITFAFSGAAHRLIESNRPTEANPRPLEGTTVVVMDYEDPIKNPLRERYEAAIAEYSRRFRVQS